MLDDSRLKLVSENGVEIDDDSGIIKLTNGLSELEKNKLKERTGWSDDIVNFIRSMYEAEIYINAKLKETEINGRKCLARCDIDLEQVDDIGKTNKERMLNGLAPYNYDKQLIELHHIGQEGNSPFAELTKFEHRGKGNFTILHNLNQQTTIDRMNFDSQRIIHWKTRTK